MSTLAAKETIENVDQLLSRAEKLVRKNVEKAKVLSDSLASVLTGQVCLHTSQCSSRACGSEYYLLYRKIDLNQLDIHKSLVPHGIQPTVLRALPDILVRPPFITFQRLWGLWETPDVWKKANVMAVFNRGIQITRTVSLMLVSAKITD